MPANPIAREAIQNHPGYSHIPGQFARVLFPSTQSTIEFCLQYCNTDNERTWGTDSYWIGLNKQTLKSFHHSHIAEHSLSLMQKEQGKLPATLTKPGQVRASVTGGSWDIPAVLAGLPLSARQRQRTRLPPKEIRLAFFMSGGIDAESMAPLTAKIAHAIWQYTVAGGAVSLHIAFCGICRRTPENGLCVETRVNTADSASLAAALSPVFFRAVSGRIITAFSLTPDESIPPPQSNPLPGYLWIGGSMSAALDAAQKTIAELSIA
jgi:hypothetical protein